MSSLIGLVATKNPTTALMTTVRSLCAGGCDKVVVVNDGSDRSDSAVVLWKISGWRRVEVINLEKNVGKSEALREGFRRLPKDCVIVQTDDDTIAGDLRIPKKLILDGKADIVDIRIEISRSNTLLGVAQEAGYWLLNVVAKRIQSLLGARTWLSGASIMYSRKAGVPMLMEKSNSMTEDTEGLYRALAKGFRVRYCANTKAEFHTMAPQQLGDLYKQWRRWSIGNGQLIGLWYKGGYKVVLMTIFTWLFMIAPIPSALYRGTYETILMTFAGSVVLSMFGAVRLKRPLLIVGGLMLPFLAIMWSVQSFSGLYLAHKLKRAGRREMTWESPPRIECSLFVQ